MSFGSQGVSRVAPGYIVAAGDDHGGKYCQQCYGYGYEQPYRSRRLHFE